MPATKKFTNSFWLSLQGNQSIVVLPHCASCELLFSLRSALPCSFKHRLLYRKSIPFALLLWNAFTKAQKWCYLYSVLLLAFCSFEFRLVVPVTGNSARERNAFHPWSHFKERSLSAQWIIGLDTSERRQFLDPSLASFYHHFQRVLIVTGRLFGLYLSLVREGILYCGYTSDCIVFVLAFITSVSVLIFTY